MEMQHFHQAVLCHLSYQQLLSIYPTEMKSIFTLAAAIGISQLAMAQAPTSLQYPTPNVYVANVSTVYLSPTVAGNVSSYSIAPTLPSGLSFNTNTGVISGVPTTQSATTSYVITATGGSNPSGSATDTLSIQVTNNYFNNQYQNINFGGSGVTVTNKVGNGTAAGAVALYENVTTISGQPIDAIVKMSSLTGGTVNAFDQTAASGTGFSNNEGRFFSPQFNFSSAGSATFEFQFILGGSYNDATNTGLPVVLQNVQINTFDIDGNGGGTSNQYNEFGGFDSSTRGGSSTVIPSYNTTSGLTKFRSSITNNVMNLTDPNTRVRVTYTNISDFRIVVGAESSGLAYFVLDFGAGPAFATAVTTAAPTIDLNTNLNGVNNAGSGCGTQVAFTAPSQTNVASINKLRELVVSYNNTSGNIPDGANEQLTINGATGTNAIALNFNSGGTNSMSLGGANYTITHSLSGTTSTIAFTKSPASDSITVAQAETLLDALHYYNAASAPASGDRKFTVNIRNAIYESPDAIFTATLNCVSIRGNIYHDVNGMTDNTVNSNGTQFTANALYAVRVNPTNNQVIDTRGIAAGGAYNFGTVTPGTYEIYVSTTSPAAGTVFTAATYPSGTSGAYKSTAENLGANAGSDLLADGKLRITVGTISVTNANFGLQIPPVTTNTNYPNNPNPGGFNAYTLTSGSIPPTDEDGSVTSITITSFPAGANYLKVGSTLYTNGGTCPPQSVCTPWPGTVTVPFSSGNPTLPISVDPSAEGNTSVTIEYTALDNGGFTSNPGTVTIGFVGASYYSISGNVWNDANGNGLRDGIEVLTSVANSSQTLYAVLVQNNNTYSTLPTVLMSTAVNAATGYSFNNVPAGNNYEVHIVSLGSTPEPGIAAADISPLLAAGWTGVSTNNGGVIVSELNTNDPINSIANLNGNKSNINFGIERTPVADNKSFVAPNSAFTLTPSKLIGGQPTYAISSASSALSGNLQKSLSGSDAEDCATTSSCNTGKTYVIKSVKPNTRIFYDFGSGNVLEVTSTLNSTLVDFDPVRLTIYGQRGQGYTDATALGFTYSIKDAAGIQSPAATYVLKTASPLPVVLSSFSGVVSNCTATLRWESSEERNSKAYNVEQSRDGSNFTTVASVESKNSSTGASYSTVINDLAAGSYFRLRIVDVNGGQEYSKTLYLPGGSCTGHDISVWPNPAADKISIGGLGNSATITIYNSLGVLVHRSTGTQNVETISISNLPTGTYLVQVSGQDGQVRNTTRLIKK